MHAQEVDRSRADHPMGHKCFSLAFTRMEHYDEIGYEFSRQLQPPLRGAAARQNKLSPLKEMTPEQLKTYTSSQLATILLQHEHAVDTALTDHHYPYSSGDDHFPPPHIAHPHVMSEAEECRMTLCPSCGRAGVCEDVSFVNIDGIVAGDIPPTVAVGWGFRPLGSRPVADVGVVRNLGLRDPVSGLLPGQPSVTTVPEEYQQSVARWDRESAFKGSTTPTEEVSAQAISFLRGLNAGTPHSSTDATTLASQGVDYFGYIHGGAPVSLDHTFKATTADFHSRGGSGGIQASATASTTETTRQKEELFQLYKYSRENTPVESSVGGIVASTTSSTTGSQSYKDDLFQLYGYSREHTPADEALVQQGHAHEAEGVGGQDFAGSEKGEHQTWSKA
ncbi:hypothetical protein BD289DRAFT_506445 [Coniella lustricola]|uniref:Uncharacterized protein n=1 Tax=Coniella lustricola TaxID=2025994 RepID=A0A2T3A6J5_9PEZI|nr:hypothetical protein BD289DRAFT_506445 [Coniella lustricola]